MKKNFKKKINNKYRPNKRLRYTSNDYSYRINTYQNSTRPTTFGPGTYKLCISKIISGALNTQVVIPLYSEILINNPEFERVNKDFKYFKINNISITFYPRNIQRLDDSNLTPCYMAMVYDNEPIENLRLQDSVKVIPAFFTRRKIFKYQIPYFEAGSGLLNAWTDSGSLGKYENIVLQLHAPDNTNSWYIRYDCNITCRGPTSQTQTKRFEEIRQVKWEKEKEMEKYEDLMEKLKEKIKEKENLKEISIGDEINIKEEIMKEEINKKEEEKDKKEKDSKIKLLERKMKLDGERYLKIINKEKEINEIIRKELEEIRKEKFNMGVEMEEDKKLLICLQEELIDKGEIEKKSKSKSCASSFVEY